MAHDRPALSRRIAWRLEALGFDLFTLLIRALPVDVASAGGAALFRALGPLTKAHRTAERGLRLAFPGMDEAERRRLLAAQWDNFGRYIAEFPVLDRLTPSGGRVEVVGGQRLAAIAASNRPAVLISGHFSNLEVMAAVIVAAGIDCDVTYRAANNPLVDARIKTNRIRYGVRLFAPVVRSPCSTTSATTRASKAPFSAIRCAPIRRRPGWRCASARSSSRCRSSACAALVSAVSSTNRSR
jgi:KDO2-lipid IV(A) lauroyltransferase